MTTAEPTNRARRAIPASRRTIAASSTKRRVGSWNRTESGSHNTLGHGIGTLRLMGKRTIETFPLAQIKRVRILKRADGYYVQFAVKADRKIAHQLTDHMVGIDVGLKSFYTDSDGKQVANPRFLRKAEQKLKRLHRRKDRKKKGGANRKKAIKRLAKGSSPSFQAA